MMGKGILENKQSITQILYLYSKATCVVINMEKSNLALNNVPEELQQRFWEEFAYTLSSMREVFKYLGFFLKPNSYSFKDCIWIYKKGRSSHIMLG